MKRILLKKEQKSPQKTVFPGSLSCCRINGKTYYRDITAPIPKFHEEYGENSQIHHYTKKQFDQLEKLDNRIEDYSIGGQTLSTDEYCGIVAACSHHEDLSDELYEHTAEHDPTFKQAIMDMGHSEKEARQIISRRVSTFITDDIMKGDLRSSQGELLGPTVNPTRKKAFEVLDKYKEGDVKPLAEMVATEIKNAMSETGYIIGGISNGARNHYEFAGALTDLLDRDPALKKPAMENGLTEDEIKSAKGFREYSKAIGASEDAKAKIARAAAKGDALTAEEKQDYAKAILKANLLEARLCAENKKNDYRISLPAETV